MDSYKLQQRLLLIGMILSGLMILACAGILTLQSVHFKQRSAICESRLADLSK